MADLKHYHKDGVGVLRTIARSRETIYISAAWKDEASYYAMRIQNSYWGIENKLHWHLDVTFREDMCRVPFKNGAVNFQRCASKFGNA